MYRQTIVILMGLLLPLFSLAGVQVAFIEGYHPDGRRAELSPGDRFFHVAIRVDGLWYDSLPKERVKGEEFLELDSSFRLGSILENKSLNLTKEDVAPYLNLGFDHTFNWKDKSTTYCSKLVANILEIEPVSVMSFEGDHWKRAKTQEKGNLGISPDELYAELLSRGFKEAVFVVSQQKSAPQCRSFL